MNQSSAGGSATAGGMRHEGACLAWASAYMLAEQPLPEWASGRRVIAVGGQTSRPVDDVALVTDVGGWITIQAKKGLNLGESEESALGEALAQLVKIFLEGVPNTFGAPGLRPIDPTRDRVLILTDAGAAQTIVNGLVPVTDRLRDLPAGVPIADVPKNNTEKRAFHLVKGHLERSWRQESGKELNEADLRALCAVLAVYRMDFSDGGPHRTTAVLMLEDLLYTPQDAPAIWRDLTAEAQRLADERSYLDRNGLVQRLENQGFALRPLARLRADIQRLRQLARDNVQGFASALTIATPDGPLSLTRAIEATLNDADGNLAITGVPGAGKTVLLHAMAEAQKSDGTDLVVLRADNLSSTTGQTRIELNTEHDLSEILHGWTGNQPGLVLIDGLDQTRGADASGWLPAMVKRLAGTRWRFVATIRAFDLKHGHAWRTMFPGQPLDQVASDRELRNVRHVLVEDLTQQELVPLRAHSTRMASLLDNADPRFRRLLANPFNLNVAGGLLAGSDSDLSSIHSNLDLLDRYWQLRVSAGAGGLDRNRAAEAVVHAMLNQGRQAVRPLDLPTTVSSAALDELSRDGVLRSLPHPPGTVEAPVSFAHPVLFDYAVALFALGNVEQPETFAEVLDRNPNLAITVRPSMEYRLATIWNLDEDRHWFWHLALRFTPDQTGHPLAAAAAALVAAREISTLTDMEELKKACTGETTDPTERWVTVNAHQLAFLIAARISRLGQPDATHSVLAAFAASLAAKAHSTHDASLALLAAQLGTRTITTKDQAAASPALADWVSCATNSMAVALEDLADPHRIQLAGISSRLLAAVAPHDTAATAETIRRLLDPQSLAVLNISALTPVIDQLPYIAATAPELAVEIGASVWDYEETRDGKTTMGGSTLLALTSTHKQDLESARYSVGETFQALLQADPSAGVKLLLHVIERPRMYYSWSTQTTAGPSPHVRTGASLAAAEGHGILSQMVQELCERLEQLAEQQPTTLAASQNPLGSIIDTLVNDLHHAKAWNRLLRQAEAAPSTQLGLALLPALGSLSIYANSTTWATAGRLAARLSPDLNASQHERLETAILEMSNAAEKGVDARVRQGLTERSRTVLNAMSANKLGPAATAVIAQGEPAAALPPAAAEHDSVFGFAPSGEPDTSMPGLLGPLAGEIHRAAEASRSRDDTVRTQSHPRLVELWKQLHTIAVSSEVVEAVDTSAEANMHELRVELAEQLATVPQVTADSEIGQQVLAALVDAVPGTVEGAEPAHTGWQSQLPAWGGTPDTNAIQGLLNLIFRPEWREARLANLTSALTPLVDDPDVLYRYLATRALPVLHTEPDALIDELERRLLAETDEHNTALLLHLLARFWHSHARRVDSMLQQLAALPTWAVLTSDPDGDIETGPEDAASVCIDMLTLLAAVDDTPHAREVVTAWLTAPVDSPHRATRAMTCMRDVLNPADQARSVAQERAFALIEPGLVQLAASFAEATATEHDKHAQERAATAIKMADNLARQLYFASGANDAQHTPDIKPDSGHPCRFAALTLPILEGLAAIHFPSVTQHIVQVADHIAHCEAKRALLTAAKAVSGDPGYANEAQGLESTLALIRRFVADHRNLVLNDAEGTTAVRTLLGAFVTRGWDQAIDLAEELHDVYT